MNAVNAATMLILSLFQKKSEELGPQIVKGHPYLIALEMAAITGTEPNLENKKFVEMALGVIRKWAKMTVGDMSASCMNEIGVLGNLALKAGGNLKKASEELLTSMDFVKSVFQIFVKSIDYDHIAEWMLNDGAKKAAATENLSELVQPVVIETPNDIDSPQKLAAFLKQQLMKMLVDMPDGEPELESLSGMLTSPPPSTEEPEKKKSDKPPVTPKDIVDMLFQNRVKPSAN